MLDSIPLIALNELANTRHNSYIKCFASRKKEKRTAFNMFQQMPPGYLSIAFQRFMLGLYKEWFIFGGDKMDTELTPEHVEEMGKIFGKQFLASLPPEERVKGLEPIEVLSVYKPEERVKGLKPQDRLKGLKPEEIRAFLDQLEKKND